MGEPQSRKTLSKTNDISDDSKAYGLLRLLSVLIMFIFVLIAFQINQIKSMQNSSQISMLNMESHIAEIDTMTKQWKREFLQKINKKMAEEIHGKSKEIREELRRKMENIL